MDLWLQVLKQFRLLLAREHQGTYLFIYRNIYIIVTLTTYNDNLIKIRILQEKVHLLKGHIVIDRISYVLFEKNKAKTLQSRLQNMEQICRNGELKKTRKNAKWTNRKQNTIVCRKEHIYRAISPLVVTGPCNNHISFSKNGILSHF